MRWIRKLGNPWLALATAALTAGAPLPGCRSHLAAPLPAAPQDDAGPRRGGTLRLASFADIRSLDPVTATDLLAGGILEHVVAGLVDYDEAGHVVDDLAARHEVLEGGRVYRFYLREGVRFHDGGELVAEDVKRSVERALHPTSPNAFRAFYDPIAGAIEFGQGKAPDVRGVQVEGRYVVSFRLTAPDATFLPLLGQVSLRPVCRSAGTRVEPGWQACGAGPFKLAPGGWDRGRSVTLVRHDGYFRPGLPYLDAVRWTFLVPLGAQRFKFEDGELDLLLEVNEPDMMAFTRDPRWARFGRFEAEREVWGEAMNVEIPPFDNLEVRRAVSAAIDRRKYRLLKPGMVREATQLLPPDVPLFDPNTEGQQVFDPAQAREHMRRAGLAGGWPRPIPYYAYPQSFGEYSVQILQQELAPLGLHLEVHLVSYPAYLAITRRRGRAAMSQQGWQQDYPDPSAYFEAVFHSKSIDDEDSNNTSFYRNGALDTLLDRAHESVDGTERKALYREASRIVSSDAPWAFTHTVRRWQIRQPLVRGWPRHAVWMGVATETWLAPAAPAGAEATGPLSRPWQGRVP